jgi:nitroreductase
MNVDPTYGFADPKLANTVETAINSRRSVRAFLERPVRREAIEHILNLGKRAPSGGNMQPWKVHIVTGNVKAELEADLVQTIEEGIDPKPEYNYYPTRWQEPFLSRRRLIGEQLYQLLGIGRRDVEARRQHYMQNFTFFGAPVGMIFCVDRNLSSGSWMDVGMFMQTIMLAARSVGMHTCPQASFTSYHQVVRKHLKIPDNDILLCGMALGYEDQAKPENHLQSPRVPLDEFAMFYDSGAS